MTHVCVIYYCSALFKPKRLLAVRNSGTKDGLLQLLHAAWLLDCTEER